MGYDAVTSAAIDAAWRSDAKIVYVVFVWGAECNTSFVCFA